MFAAQKDGCSSCIIGLAWLRLHGVTVWQSAGSETFSQSKQIGPRVAGYSREQIIKSRVVSSKTLKKRIALFDNGLVLY